MKNTIALYGLGISGAALALQWLEYKYTIRVFSTEIYIAIIALSFTAFGVWVGNRLAGGGRPKPFQKNVQALEYLGISEREYQVLELLAEGHTNKEMAERLFVSPNTVKTHLAHLYGKLDVSRRTQAIQKARGLGMIR